MAFSISNWTFDQDWIIWACHRAGIHLEEAPRDANNLRDAGKIDLQAFGELVLHTGLEGLLDQIEEMKPPAHMTAGAKSDYQAALTDVIALIEKRAEGLKNMGYYG
jgi:hypothetical protein